MAQQRDIDKQRARERAEMAIERANQEREAEEAQIKAEEEVEKSKISQKAGYRGRAIVARAQVNYGS